jgi:hypothetical protein
MANFYTHERMRRWLSLCGDYIVGRGDRARLEIIIQRVHNYQGAADVTDRAATWKL